MPKIKLENGKEVNISQAEHDALVEKAKPEKDWRAEERGDYWFVTDSHNVNTTTEYGDGYDDYHHATGNYFRTREEATAYRKEQLANGPRNKAIRRVNARIKELNDGWVADWSDRDQEKWNIIFNYSENRFESVWGYKADFFSVFADTESAEIADQIIDEMEDDLRIIIGVAK